MPHNSVLRHNLAWLLLKRGKLDEALATLDEALQKVTPESPDGRVVALRRAGVLAAMGRLEESRAVIQAVRPLITESPMDGDAREALRDASAALGARKE